VKSLSCKNILLPIEHLARGGEFTACRHTGFSPGGSAALFNRDALWDSPVTTVR